MKLRVDRMRRKAVDGIPDKETLTLDALNDDNERLFDNARNSFYRRMKGKYGNINANDIEITMMDNSYHTNQLAFIFQYHHERS